MKTKICGMCKKELDVSFFRGNKAKKDGLQTQCIECRKEYNKKHYIKNKKVYNERTKKRNKELREWFTEYKKTLFCNKCGDNRWYVLDFHHKNGEEKDLNVSILVNYGKKRILEEIKKCDVLCSNCHRELHHFEKNRSVADRDAAVSKTVLRQ